MLRARAPHGALATIEQHVDNKYGEMVVRSARDESQYSVQLHPAGEDVEFALDAGEVVVSAKTSTVGPGYHAFLCELLHELPFEWRAGEDEGDETGYFETRDREALEGEMLAWLGGLANMLAERVAEGDTGFMISLPIDTVFEYDAAIATPTGPRDVQWIETVRSEPRNGIDLFPWWQPGLGADYYRGRALTLMWTEVRWREPLDEDESDLLEAIDDHLAAARGLDPSIDLPWAEWAEIARFLDYDDPTNGRGGTPTIGYRRRPVRVSLTGGWTVQVPGEMAASFDKEGTWSAHVPGRTIWMSSFRIGDPESTALTAASTLPKPTIKGTETRIPGLGEEYAYRATVGETDEGDHQLAVEIAVPHRLALFTFVVDELADLEWAKGVAASIAHA